MARVLGIDPGSRVTGFGVIETVRSRQQYIASGCIRAGSGDLPARIGVIFEGIREVIATYAPDEVAVEQVFMHRNADSALKLGQARGAAICAVVSGGLVVSEYTPTAIKQAIVGKGHAAKAQVQHMVQALLQLPGSPQADAADALAVALCHIQTSHTLGRLAMAGAGAKP